MRKKEVLFALSQLSGVSTREVNQVLVSISTLVGEKVNADKVVIPYVGTFKMLDKKARMGHNPHTGEPLEIPAKRVLRVKASSKIVFD